MPPKNALVISKRENLQILDGDDIQEISRQAARFGVHREPGADGHPETVIDIEAMSGVDITRAVRKVKETLGITNATIIYFKPPEDKPPYPNI
ncbi:MAG: hypothetical protein AAB961_00870 [Patescibacteria group bacterium]